MVLVHEEFFLIGVVALSADHVCRYCHCTAVWNSLKAEIKRAFIAPVDSRNYTNALACKICSTLSISESIVQLHDMRHFQIHTKIRGQDGR